MLKKNFLTKQTAEICDPEQIAFFNSLSSEWWNPNGKFRSMHAFNRTRRTYIENKIAQKFNRDLAGVRTFEGLRILDVGCGGGLMAEPLAALGAEVVGVDAAIRNITIATQHAEQNNVKLHYRHGTLETSVKAEEQFDVILNLEVIEHVPNPGKLVQNCVKLLSSGGLLFVATLNRTYRSFGLAIIGAEYVLRWLPVGTHKWSRFVTPAELGDYIGLSGPTIIDRIGVSFSPLKWRWDVRSDLSVNYMLVAEQK